MIGCIVALTERQLHGYEWTKGDRSFSCILVILSERQFDLLSENGIRSTNVFLDVSIVVDLASGSGRS